MTKDSQMFFDKSVATVILFFETVLKTSGKCSFQPDGAHSKLLLFEF